MTVIRQDDFIDSVADALQFISYYHPKDFVDAVHEAWKKEQNPACLLYTSDAADDFAVV